MKADALNFSSAIFGIQKIDFGSRIHCRNSFILAEILKSASRNLKAWLIRLACVRNLRPWPDSATRHAGHGPRTGSNPVRDVRRNARSWPWCPRFASPAAWAAPRRAGARWSRFGGCRRTVRSAPQRRHVAPHAGAVLPRRSRGLQPPPIRLQIGSVPAKRECRGFRVLVGVKLGYIGLRPSTENTPHSRRAAPAD